MIAAASRAGQTTLYVVFATLVGACAIAFAQRGIALPGLGFQFLFWAAPCLVVFLVIRLSRNQRTPMRLLIWLGAMALGIVTLRGQMKLLAAYASGLEDAPLGGVLSNFYVTAHSAFDAPLLAAAAGSFLLSISAHRWAGLRRH